MYIVNFCRNRRSWETQADTKAASTYTAEYNIAYGVHILNNSTRSTAGLSHSPRHVLMAQQLTGLTDGGEGCCPLYETIDNNSNTSQHSNCYSS